MNVSAIMPHRWRKTPSVAGDVLLPDPSPWAMAQRRLFDEIGEFLFAHGLTVNDHNLTIARAHLEGNRTIGARIDMLLRTQASLSDADLGAIENDSATRLTPERLGEIAKALNAKLLECLRIIGQSSALARDYGAAVDSEARGFAGDPVASFDRLLTLTRTVIEGTSDLGSQLDRAHQESERLRTNLTRARREADHDHLTGLLNRRSFECRLDALPLDPDDRPDMCVALCDIDRFKTINDQYGHDVGDRVLRHFARHLRKALAGRAIVARYGGEEFACLFETTAVTEARGILDAVRERFEQRILCDRDTGQPMTSITFSAGLAAIDARPRDAMLAADHALYEAKRSGRNRLVVEAALADRRR